MYNRTCCIILQVRYVSHGYTYAEGKHVPYLCAWPIKCSRWFMNPTRNTKPRSSIFATPTMKCTSTLWCCSRVGSSDVLTKIPLNPYVVLHLSPIWLTPLHSMNT